MKKTLTLRKTKIQNMTLMKIWTKKEWTGKIWRGKLLQMIGERAEETMKIVSRVDVGEV